APVGLVWKAVLGSPSASLRLRAHSARCGSPARENPERTMCSHIRGRDRSEWRHNAPPNPSVFRAANRDCTCRQWLLSTRVSSLVPAVIGFARPPVIRTVTGAEQNFSLPAMAFFAFEPRRQAFHGGGRAIALDQIEDGVRFDEALMSAGAAFRDHAEME